MHVSIPGSSPFYIYQGVIDASFRHQKTLTGIDPIYVYMHPFIYDVGIEEFS